MERARESVRACCSSSQPINEEEEWQASPLSDRAARKEIERQRLRKLLNQGKQKRRRFSGSKILGSVPLVPRKARSVGCRRRCKSWKSIGLLAAEKLSSFSVQNEFEIEFEIAEVLSGLKRQVSSSDESTIDDLDRIRFENEGRQAISAACAYSGDKASECGEIFKSSNCIANMEVQSHDKAKLTASAEVIPTLEIEAAESKQVDKFIIDLNELPPMESSEGMEMEIKSERQDLDLRNPEDAMPRRSELRCPTRAISGNPPQGFSAAELEFYSNGFNQENHSRPASTPGITHEHASHQIPKPLQSGRIKVGPLIYPLSENQSVMVNHQSGLSRTAPSTGNVRFTYPIRAPFLSVLPGNGCARNPSYEGNHLHSSGGKNTQPVPFLDEQLHPPLRRLLPVQIQNQKQANSSVSDIRTYSSHRNGTQQSVYPPCSSNGTSMPSAASLFSFASSAQSPLHLSQNPQVVKTSMGMQYLPADHGSQQRNSEMIQKINQANSLLAAGEAPSWIKQSGFVLKSHTTSGTTPNWTLSATKQNSLSARVHQSSSSSFGASVQLKNQQQLQAMSASQLERVSTDNNQHQPPIAAKVSGDFSILSASLYDRSSTLHNPSQQKLSIPNSQPLT